MSSTVDDVAVDRAAADVDRHLALRRELHRVGEQVGQDLRDATAIAAHRARDVVGEVDRQLQPLAVRGRGDDVRGGLDHLAQVEVALLELEVAGLDLRDVQDVVDDQQQLLARGAGGRRVLALLVVELGVEQQLRHPDDAVERGPDLVAHVGQERGLGPRRLLGAGAGHARLGLAADPADGEDRQRDEPRERRDEAGDADDRGAVGGIRRPGRLRGLTARAPRCGTRRSARAARRAAPCRCPTARIRSRAVQAQRDGRRPSPPSRCDSPRRARAAAPAARAAPGPRRAPTAGTRPRGSAAGRRGRA